MIEITEQQAADLEFARELVRRGVPMFLARPDPSSREGFALPGRWDGVTADVAVVDAWQPGWALCAVTGHVFDLVDIDPRSGGTEASVPMPYSHLVADTPSGGRHHFVRAIGVGSRDGVYAGVDLKSGTPDGTGRGFAFIAPTVRASKVDGTPRAYRWTHGRLPEPAELATDHTGGGLRARVLELRRAAEPTGQVRRLPESVARREFRAAWERLCASVVTWQATGWGGEAHAGLLAASTHLARLNGEYAMDAFVSAFRTAGVEPDEADLAKMESALDNAVPDLVVPDSELSAADAFLMGGEPHVPQQPPPAGGRLPAAPADPSVFAFVTPDRARGNTERPRALYGAFGGGVPLIYPDGVHWLQGESESGKSWVALAVLLDVLRAGRLGIFVDHEDSEERVFERLAQLGATDDEFGRLVYLNGHDVSHVDVVTHLASGERPYALLVVDGVTAALSAAGLSGRNEQELTAWADQLLRQTPAAVVVDHVVKDTENRGGMAIGSQAKKSVVTGTSFEVICTEKFARGIDGVIELRMQKDKKGSVRAELQGRKHIRLKFISDANTGAVTLSVPVARPVQTDASQLIPSEGDEARIYALVAAMEVTPELHAGHSLRHVTRVLQDNGHTVDKNLMSEAYQVFRVRAGVPGVKMSERMRSHTLRADYAAGKAIA
jgi:KaiC/GvpD/RAD55 family RecA-like ATPase